VESSEVKSIDDPPNVSATHFSSDTRAPHCFARFPSPTTLHLTSIGLGASCPYWVGVIGTL